MGVKVVQLASQAHRDTILASLHQMRLEGQLSDVTVQVDYEGHVQDFRAHQVMLAASSGYFKTALLSPDAARDKILLSNMHRNEFSTFLEFVYTGKVEVSQDKIGDVQAAAQFLDCEDLLVVCGEAMSAGNLRKHTKKTLNSSVAPKEASHGAKTRGKRAKQPNQQPSRVALKRQLSPQTPGNEVASKRLKARDVAKEEQVQRKKPNLRLAGRKVLQRRLNVRQKGLKNVKQVKGETESRPGAEAEPESPVEREEGASLTFMSSDLGGWECEEGLQSANSDEPASLSLGEDEDGEEEEEEEEEEQSKKRSKKTSKAQFECTKCQRTFHYERSYIKHISTYHGVAADVVFRCETCQQTFANRSNLKIHEKHVHSNERLFACESCAKTFKRKKDVVRHQRQVHERDSMQNVCAECGKALSSKTALLLHERTHTGAKPFECSDCGARFTQNSALKMHHRTHTGEKPFACDQCDARFTQKHMLAYHKRSHTGEKPFMCEACGKSFASKEYLRHHSNIHTGSKPYKCTQCGRGFAQRNSLHQHLKIHTGERPYSCKDCDKHFTQLNALQRHQRIHTGEKPYMCSLCNRTFTDKSTLRRHTMIHDAETPWKTYLVVLEGNVEDKKPKAPPKGKTDKEGAVEKKSAGRRGAAKGAAEAAAGAGADTDTAVVSAEPVTLPPDWASHGAIALVSHGGITVIHTDVAPGGQIQPIVTTDGAGASIISLDGPAISIPFSIPVSSEASSAGPSALSVPVSTSSVLEAAVSQTILAPVSEAKESAEAGVLQPDIQTVIVGESVGQTEQTATVQSDGEPSLGDNILVDPKENVCDAV